MHGDGLIFKWMDGQIKPGHDGMKVERKPSSAMAGLDPAIHPFKYSKLQCSAPGKQAEADH